jgi:hypothetical protein
MEKRPQLVSKVTEVDQSNSASYGILYSDAMFTTIISRTILI